MKKLLFVSILYSITLIGCGQTATFSSNFEDQNTDPEIGDGVLLETGTSGSFDVVPNPHPDSRNSSDYVLKVATGPGTGGRAEYSAGNYETNEKTFIYTWKRFHPTDMFTDITITGWVLVNQWKTWPCEYYGSGQYDYSDEICYSGGIFNEIEYDEPGIIGYKSRAEPDCNVDYGTMPKGYWNEFVLEIYWTNTNNGYYRIWRNGTLFGYSDNIKTLFDGFLEGTCDVYWATGLYTYWSKTGRRTQDFLKAYIDDITIYAIDNRYAISDICPDCEPAPSVPTDTIVYKENVNRSFAEPDGYSYKPCSEVNIIISGTITPDTLSEGVGTIDIGVTGGTEPYTYTWWRNSETSQYISGLTEGSYPITVADKNGCFSMASFELDNIDP